MSPTKGTSENMAQEARKLWCGHAASAGMSACQSALIHAKAAGHHAAQAVESKLSRRVVDLVTRREQQIGSGVEEKMVTLPRLIGSPGNSTRCDWAPIHRPQAKNRGNLRNAILRNEATTLRAVVHEIGSFENSPA
ncbi:hypothetical protein PGQ11_006338 [Apiospora arundinis]|uniref:Uncharacterized protein n=1 Tax=Apiospora arundinis TaxID=335852 RepID=A0ABR2ISH9_9PEZI